MEYLRLFDWYHTNKRDLPFRKTSNPYLIWVSEVMLQQTQVDTMLPYYERFIKRFPTVESLALSTIEEVLTIVSGIGYYKRFRMLKKGASYVYSNLDGILPKTYDELRKIPGIGAYTAGAIMSIAYNLAYPATDGNVIRVLSRVYEINDDFRLDKHRKKLDIFNKELIERSNNPHDYTQSMMELGATVCKKSNPDCKACPLNSICLAKKHQTTMNYPVLSPLKSKKEINYFVFILKYEETFIVRKRTEELLNGFNEFIFIESDSLNGALLKLEALGFDVVIYENYPKVKHVFTHLVWHMEVYSGISKKVPDSYLTIKNFSNMPLSTVMDKLIKTTHLI